MQLTFNDHLSSQDHGPVSLFPEQGTKEAIQMTVISGLRCLELSENQGRVGSLAKMLLKSSKWISQKCFLTWKIQAIPPKYFEFLLVPWVQNTNEKEFGWLPTPTANKSITASMKALQKEAIRLHPTYKTIGTQVAVQSQCNSPDLFLNPDWIESVMGYPEGWTELNV